MPSIKKLLQAAAGNAGGESLYVEDVFSTYLYTPSISNSNIPINNGIDLDGEGGMVWFKKRTGGTQNHSLVDTVRGGNNLLTPNGTFAAYSADIVSSFNTDGFTTGTSSFVSTASEDYASWTFRKAEKFFDVVTYTGNGVAGREIAHNLGSTPAVIIVKKTSGTYNWQIYHSSLGATKFLEFTNYFAQTSSAVWNDTEPTDSVFTVGSEYGVNQSGDTYVAYLFASDAGGFGDDGDENIIKCGEFSVDGSYEADVECGFEPQWVLIKPAEDSATWNIFDTMRGAPVGGDAYWLAPDLNIQEAFTANRFNPTATGFHIGNYGITAGNKIIYIAIRRPMKTPESGTEVFAVDEANSGTNPNFYSGFPVDVSIRKYLTNSTQSPELETRLTNKKLETGESAAENATDSGWWDWQDGVSSSGHGTGTFAWMFKRATGFFDVVAYTGTGATHTESHNLGVTPEFMIVKQRTSTSSWTCWHSGLSNGGNSYIDLNENSSEFSSTNMWGGTEPTNSVFTVGPAATRTNDSSSTYIAYLFATLDGVSKVGSYTGTGADLNVDCGFSAGARFILIKRSDSTGDWYYWDSVRGIAVGNDPYLLLNTTAAEVTGTDYIDPLSSGFTVTSSAPAALNASGGTYIFLAIA